MAKVINVEQIILGFTCRECEWECTADPTSIVTAGTPQCCNCDIDMELDTTVDIAPQQGFYFVFVDDCTPEQADQVMQERITHDEDYGFEYTISYEAA